MVIGDDLEYLIFWSMSMVGGRWSVGPVWVVGGRKGRESTCNLKGN